MAFGNDATAYKSKAPGRMSSFCGTSSGVVSLCKGRALSRGRMGCCAESDGGIRLTPGASTTDSTDGACLDASHEDTDEAPASSTDDASRRVASSLLPREEERVFAPSLRSVQPPR
eukprot:scaffold44854_cov33-Tisochrysis_lutea.AAC.1